MKTLLAFVLLCESLFAADSSVQLKTTTTTDAEAKTVSTHDEFTRDGKIDLVRDTKTKDGKAMFWRHRFYYDGALLGTFTSMPDSSGFMGEPNASYCTCIEFDASKNPRSIVIGTKDGTVLDAFDCSNDLFTPVDSSTIKKVNALGADLKQLFDPEHVRNTSPDDFGREAVELVEKHKEK